MAKDATSPVVVEPVAELTKWIAVMEVENVMRNVPLPPGWRNVLPLLVFGLAVGCAQKSAERESQRSLPDEYVEGSFIVTVSSETSSEQLESLAMDAGAQLGCSLKKPERVDWGSTQVLSEEMANTYNVRYENCDLSRSGTEAILATLSGTSSVVSVEPEAIASAIPILENDPYKRSQGHLPFIRRDEACNLAGQNDKPIIVAVVDSGVDVDHPDLQDAFLRDARGEIVGANFVGAGSSMPPDRNFDDGTGHGTHVAGLIAATSGNGQGVVGVGACANVKIMPLRALNDEGRGSTLEIERAIKWAADKGAHIINLSLGYTATSYSNSPSNFRRSLYETLAAQNVVVFAAAGNDGYENGSPGENGGTRWHFPSSYDRVIAVAATNDSGTLTSFTNYGARVDIAAPGASVLSTIRGSYGRMSGTSMATPVAAGAYALALAAAQPVLEGSSTGLKDRIDDSVANEILSSAILSRVSLPKSKVASGGVIDVAKLVEMAKSRYPAIDDDEEDDRQDFGDEAPSEDPTVDEPANDQPRNDRPDQPSDRPTVGMRFAGLVDGGRPGWPQELKVENLPRGTYAVYFYWGDSNWSFTKVYTKSYYTYAKDPNRWYLYGERTLRAVAIDKYGRILGKTEVRLKGY